MNVLFVSAMLTMYDYGMLLVQQTPERGMHCFIHTTMI